MLSIVFLWYAPLSCLIVAALVYVTSMLWHDFAKINSGLTDMGERPLIVAKALYFSGVVFILFLNFLPQCDLIITGLQRIQLTIIALALISSSVIFKNANVVADHIVFCAFVAISALFLMLSSNLITTFFVLELINMLIIYSFFFNSNLTKVVSSQLSVKISSSCVYQFILNFFSSIVLYVSINRYISLTGGASMSNIHAWQLDADVNLTAGVILIAFLLKFGSGPWIFFKITVYRNMSFITVFMYTTIYMLAILTFFANLLFVHGVNVVTSITWWLILIASLACIGFSSLAFQNTNFFVFLSFSSLINIAVFLLQMLTALVFK